MISAGMDADRIRPVRGVMTRQEAADYLAVSVRKIQRLEAQGLLRRCPGLGGAVRYPIGDVLKLASADWKEK